MQTEYSFGRRVVSTAFANSLTLLKSRLRAGAVALVSLVVGFVVQYAVAGTLVTARSVIVAIVSALAVPAVLFLLKFGWQLLLAPSEIVYAMLRPILEGGQLYGVAVATNSSIWKRKQSYSAGEFAALLDGMDPSSPASTINSKSYLTLILDDLRSNKLKFSRPPGVSPDGNYYPDIGTVIAKNDAIEWAEDHGFGSVIMPLRD